MRYAATLLFFGFIAVSAVCAEAQRTLNQSPSVRAQGMGRSSVAVHWGRTNYWANAALLAYENGLRYDQSEAFADLATGNSGEYESKQMSGGYRGVGVSMTGGVRDGLGRRIYYGPRSPSEPELLEVMNSYGIGLSAAQIMDDVLAENGIDAPPIAPYFDVAVGYSYNIIRFYEDVVTEDARLAEGDTHDFGVLARVSPHNTLDTDGFMGALDDAVLDLFGGMRVDVAFGLGVRNMGRSVINISEFDPFELPRRTLTGWSIHVVTGFPGRDAGTEVSLGTGWFADIVTPLINWGYSEEWWSDDGVLLDGESMDGYKWSGWELTIADVFSIRRGRIENEDLGIDLETSGWGAGVLLGDIVGFRYDRSTFPLSTVFSDVGTESFTVFFNVPAWL